MLFQAKLKVCFAIHWDQKNVGPPYFCSVLQHVHTMINLLQFVHLLGKLSWFAT